MFRIGISPTKPFLPNSLFGLSLCLLLLLCLPGKEVVAVGFQPWTCLWFSWTGRHQIIKNREQPKTNCQDICEKNKVLWQFNIKYDKKKIIIKGQWTITHNEAFYWSLSR